MNDTSGALPDSPIEGLIPTLNNTGWMTTALDEMSVAFTDYAGQAGGEVLDIGCAYGIATLAALEKGARVLACDIEPGHLEILEQRVPDDLRERLRTSVAVLPDADFPAGSFSAILAARVLHFLKGPDVEQAVGKMADWLKPGGRLFLIADTPYVGPWKSAAGEYERRKAAGEPWPGFIADYRSYLPDSVNADEHPEFLNPMDPDLLAGACEAAGLKVLDARFLSGSTPSSTGREHAGVIAQKT
ncbi:MAG TPA: class I SAM-dependent methyltransferase [Chromatiales bacterium]|nr:class I SAM-dependent methyltransferase [Chromatiales bacterium]